MVTGWKALETNILILGFTWCEVSLESILTIHQVWECLDLCHVQYSFQLNHSIWTVLEQEEGETPGAITWLSTLRNTRLAVLLVTGNLLDV